jgi:hypothetical protein
MVRETRIDKEQGVGRKSREQPTREGIPREEKKERNIECDH